MKSIRIPSAFADRLRAVIAPLVVEHQCGCCDCDRTHEGTWFPSDRLAHDAERSIAALSTVRALQAVAWATHIVRFADAHGRYAFSRELKRIYTGYAALLFPVATPLVAQFAPRVTAQADGDGGQPGIRWGGAGVYFNVARA